MVSILGVVLDRHQTVRSVQLLSQSRQLTDCLIYVTYLYRSRLNTDGTVADPNFVSLAQRTGGTDAEEASATYYYQGNYYLFTSWDKCCSGQYIVTTSRERFWEYGTQFLNLQVHQAHTTFASVAREKSMVLTLINLVSLFPMVVAHKSYPLMTTYVVR